MADEGMPEGRVCTKCGEYKPLTEFSPHKHGKYGRQPRCRRCCDAAKFEWIAAHPDEYKSRRKGYNRAHAAANTARAKAWHEANPGKVQARVKAWREANPEKRRAQAVLDQNRRRALDAGASGSHTEEQWQELVRRAKGRCARCGRKRKLTRDHIIPLSKGGSNDITNIQPLCGPCNSSKGTQVLHLI